MLKASEEVANAAEADCCAPRPEASAAEFHQWALAALAAHRWDEALDLIDQAIARDGARASFHSDRGAILDRLGRLEEALASFDRALALKPQDADVCSNRAIVLARLGRLDAALAAYDDAMQFNPDQVRAHAGRGWVLDRLGRFDDALSAYEQALARAPNQWQTEANRGVVLMRLGRMEAALAAFDRALALAPDCAELHINRGDVLRALGRGSEALVAFDRAFELKPDLATGHNARGNALKDQGRLDEALVAFRRAVELRPAYASAHSNLLYCLLFDPGWSLPQMVAAHRQWAARHAGHAPAVARLGMRPDPDRPLRVGLVSRDFGRHPIGYLLMPVAAALDPAQIELLFYSDRLQEDDLSERLRACAAGWRVVRRWPDAKLAAAVQDDAIDILIDLAGHTAGNRLTLFARRPAPLQVGWLGYPFTTGLPAISHVLMDDATVPAGSEQWFVEQVVRLPQTRFCYEPPVYAPAPAPAPALERGAVTFGSFNTLTKINADVLALWARLLTAVPGSRLILKWRTLVDPGTCERLREALRGHGVDPARIELRGWSSHADMLGEYGDVDIALDTFPYSGGVTSLEALWQGVPVVTLPGGRPVSRQTAGLLRCLERSEWAAHDAGDYVRIAHNLAADPERLNAIRQQQRARMASSALCDGARFAREFEAALRGLWHGWCAGQAAQPRAVRPNLDDVRPTEAEERVHA